MVIIITWNLTILIRKCLTNGWQIIRYRFIIICFFKVFFLHYDFFFCSRPSTIYWCYLLRGSSKWYGSCFHFGQPILKTFPPLFLPHYYPNINLIEVHLNRSKLPSYLSIIFFRFVEKMVNLENRKICYHKK